MKRKKASALSPKAASAALALTIPLLGAVASPFPLPQLPHKTLPATISAEEALDSIRFDYHFQAVESPILLKEYLNDFPASEYAAEARLMLADWYFFNGEYPQALSWYNEIPDNAFSGDIKERMLYRKAFSLLKTGFYEEAALYFGPLASSKNFGPDAAFYIAYIDYVKGDYDRAYKQFQTLKSLGAKGAEAEYYLNQIDYRNGEYRKVASTSERLLASGYVPDELRAETMRVGGLAHFKLGDKKKAVRLLSDYADRAGDGAEISALYALATIYYEEGNLSKALPLFSIVTEYPGPTAQSAWLYIGQIHLAQGDNQAAALAFDKAAKESWDPVVAETAAYNLAVSSSAGQSLPFADSAAAMERFIEIYPNSQYAPSLSSYLANAYYARRDYENALKQIDKIKNPDAQTLAVRQKILYQLGISYYKGANYPQAVRVLSEASSGTADKNVAAQAALWLGDSYFALKNYRDASSAYSKAISLGLTGENKALAEYNIGYSWLKLRNYRNAETAFKTAISSPALDPRLKTDARLRYADCLYYNGKYSEALAQFRDIKLDGGQDGAYALIRESDILGKDGKATERIAILEKVVGNPESGVWIPEALERLAQAYSEKGDDRKAAEIYSRIIDDEAGTSDRSQAYYSLATNADNLFNAGEREAAYAAYKRLENSGIPALLPTAVMGLTRTASDKAEIAEYASKAASTPGLTAEELNEAAFLGAQASLDLGNPYEGKALETLRQLAGSADRLWGARAAVTLGQYYIDHGNLTEAEDILIRLIDDGSDDNYWLARGYIALSDVYAAQDKDYLARLYLETLQTNYPGKEKDINQMISSRLKSLK